MTDVEQILIEKIPVSIKKNIKIFNLLSTEIHNFFFAPGDIKTKCHGNTYILQKDNFANHKPYHNNSFNYLKFQIDNQEQCQLYCGVTKKITDEDNQRHSILNTKTIQCYYNQDQNLHVDIQNQTFQDDETKAYPGLLFRYVEAAKEKLLFHENGKCIKKETYQGYAIHSLPFLHQSLENSIVSDDDFNIHIDCPNYEFVNIIDNQVYIRKLYDPLEGEKIFTTTIDNIDDNLNIVNENILIPIDIDIWNEVMNRVMKKS